MSLLQDFLNTGRGLKVALWLGKMIPPWLAFAALRIVTRISARRSRSRMAAAVRSNLAVVLDTTSDDPALTARVADVLFHAGAASYEFFHKVGRGREALGELATIPPELFELLDQAERDGQGVIAVTSHLGALDLLGVAVSSTDYEIQVISYSKPPAGYQIVNELRSDHGLIMTPASKEAMVEAVSRLESGGIVFTALDRPVPPGRQANEVEFFGRSTRLWNGYARLAMSTGSLLLFVWMERTTQGDYRVRWNEPIDCADPPGDTDAVTRMMLAQAEEAIKAHPEQWLMFFPLWPESDQLLAPSSGVPSEEAGSHVREQGS